MSVYVMSMVFKRYHGSGNEMLLALALADHADDEGARIFPTVATLAEKTRQSARTVQRQLAKMVENGWLILAGRHDERRYAPNEYFINPEWIVGRSMDEIRGDNLSPLDALSGVTPVTPLDGLGVTPVTFRGDNCVTTKEPSHNRHYGVTDVTPARSSDEPTEQDHIEFDAEQGIFIHVSEAQMMRWEDTYRGLDVDEELAKAEAWYVANPRKRKRNHLRFINGWLGRAHRELRAKPRSPPPAVKQGVQP